jgi:hypothetical protein
MIPNFFRMDRPKQYKFLRTVSPNCQNNVKPVRMSGILLLPVIVKRMAKKRHKNKVQYES